MAISACEAVALGEKALVLSREMHRMLLEPFVISCIVTLITGERHAQGG